MDLVRATRAGCPGIRWTSSTGRALHVVDGMGSAGWLAPSSILAVRTRPPWLLAGTAFVCLSTAHMFYMASLPQPLQKPAMQAAAPTWRVCIMTPHTEACACWTAVLACMALYRASDSLHGDHCRCQYGTQSADGPYADPPAPQRLALAGVVLVGSYEAIQSWRLDSQASQLQAAYSSSLKQLHDR